MAVSLAQGAKEAAKALQVVRDDLTACYWDTLLDIGESLVFYTPLLTGLASSNWNVSKSGQMQPERQPQEGVKGASSLSAMNSQIPSIEIGDTAIYNNPVKYIDDLDSGLGSRKAPAGMTVPTASRVDGIWLANLKRYKLV